MIHKYEKEIKEKLSSFSPFILHSHFERSFDEDTGILFIKGTILFIDESILEFSEKKSELNHRYRFQYMDKNKKLITRWDNVPHHKDIRGFPHHKHTLKTIESSNNTNLVEVLDEIISAIKIL